MQIEASVGTSSLLINTFVNDYEDNKIHNYRQDRGKLLLAI